MKKIIFILLGILFIVGMASAQNANRSGFFLEAGVGGMVGDSPRTSITVENNVMQYKCISGTVADFGMGVRMRFANHWAYEIKAEGQFPLEKPLQALVGRFLPIGFRYTSGELWRNHSIFAHINLGGAITVNNGIIGEGNLHHSSTNVIDMIKDDHHGSFVLFPNTPETEIIGYVGKEGYGISYSAGVGVNLSNHLYIEGCLNAQSFFNSFGQNGKGIVTGGVATFILGYRF